MGALGNLVVPGIGGIVGAAAGALVGGAFGGLFGDWLGKKVGITITGYMQDHWREDMINFIDEQVVQPVIELINEAIRRGSLPIHSAFLEASPVLN